MASRAKTITASGTPQEMTLDGRTGDWFELVNQAAVGTLLWYRLDGGIPAADGDESLCLLGSTSVRIRSLGKAGPKVKVVGSAKVTIQIPYGGQ